MVEEKKSRHYIMIHQKKNPVRVLLNWVENFHSYYYVFFSSLILIRNSPKVFDHFLFGWGFLMQLKPVGEETWTSYSYLLTVPRRNIWKKNSRLPTQNNTDQYEKGSSYSLFYIKDGQSWLSVYKRQCFLGIMIFPLSLEPGNKEEPGCHPAPFPTFRVLPERTTKCWGENEPRTMEQAKEQPLRSVHVSRLFQK